MTWWKRVYDWQQTARAETTIRRDLALLLVWQAALAAAQLGGLITR